MVGMLTFPKELMKIQCLLFLVPHCKNQCLKYKLHSDDLCLQCLHRAENYSSKGNLSFSPLKTLDSHIGCLLDPELSIFLPDKNVFSLFVCGTCWFFLETRPMGLLLTPHRHLDLKFLQYTTSKNCAN